MHDNNLNKNTKGVEGDGSKIWSPNIEESSIYDPIKSFRF